MSDDLSDLNAFTGTARLFPLPNLVLFPQVIQPLHIFEPRYRQMTADALETDRLITLVLLQAGWEADYQGQPALHPVACLGKIVADQRLDDGRYNLLLRGLKRVRIEQEIPSGKLYRSARVAILNDINTAMPGGSQHLRERLAAMVPRWFAAQEALLEQFQKLLASDLPLGALCDVFSFALPLDVEFKQVLLEELDPDVRTAGLLAQLASMTPPAGSEAARPFPPSFSAN